LEPVGEQVERAAAGTSKSAISRHFVKATETALAELLARGLDDLDLVASMLDRVHVGLHRRAGHRHRRHQAPAGRCRGDTENTAVVTDLLVGLCERGLDVTCPITVVIDGAKALRAAACPASSNWQRFGSVKVGCLAVGEAQVDVERPVPGECLLRPDGVELDAVVLGVAGEDESVGDVFAVEPFVFQRLETALANAVLTGRSDAGADVVQLGAGQR
jgi:hypothetical protein